MGSSCGASPTETNPKKRANNQTYPTNHNNQNNQNNNVVAQTTGGPNKVQNNTPIDNDKFADMKKYGKILLLCS